MAIDLDDLAPEVTAFLAERHLATLSTVRADGSVHVVPVGFGYDAGERLARVITFAPSAKARLARAGGRGALCQIDGRRWLTLEGRLSVTDEPVRVAAAVAAYAARYRQPSERADRVAIELRVDRMLGSL